MSLWKPTTSGEELFLRVHEHVGASLKLTGDDSDLGFLIAPCDFEEFVKLSATTEVFTRCIRDARSILDSDPNIGVDSLSKYLRRNIELPQVLWRDLSFRQLVNLAAQIANRKARNKAIENNAISSLPNMCYMCGATLQRKRKAPDRYTVEHIWPISFGGETIEGNLLPACKNCNSNRGHMFNWAAGPVQSTFLHSHDIDKIPNQLKFSLALARMFFYASSGRKPKTLKDAAIQGQPLIVDLNLLPNHHHLFFELFPGART